MGWRPVARSVERALGRVPVTDRLTRLTPAQLTEDQQAVYDSVAGGDRAKGVQHFPLTAGDGSLNGPFGVMLHAPQVGRVLSDLGATIRYRTSLTARVREIAILLVAAKLDSPFEWYAHERVGRAVGLTDEELAQLANISFSSRDEAEQAAADVCLLALGNADASSDEFSRFAQILGNEAVIELVTLVGYYWTLAQLMRVFDIGVPSE